MGNRKAKDIVTQGCDLHPGKFKQEEFSQPFKTRFHNLCTTKAGVEQFVVQVDRTNSYSKRN